MPVSLYLPKESAFIRVGPDHNVWGDDYRISLDLEILHIGIIGGLDKRISAEEYRAVVRKVRDHGLTPAKRRAKHGLDHILLIPVR